MAKLSSGVKQDRHADTNKNLGVIAGHRKGSISG